MTFVESASFSFIFNGERRGFVKPERGIRHGDLSRYMFLFYPEGLFYLLHDTVQLDALHGYLLCSNALSVSSFVFKDDSIIFHWATFEETEVIKSILASYETAYRQKINLRRSNVLFAKCIP